jgi:PAS domain S-box-containing protein
MKSVGQGAWPVYALQNIRVAIVAHAADTSIVAANAMAQELLGLTEDQLLGKTAVHPAWHFLRHDGSVMPVEEYPVNQVLGSGQPLRDMIAGIRRPGREPETWVLVNAEPVTGDDGKTEEVIVTFVDISRRRRAEEALKNSEQAKARANRELRAISICNQTLLRATNERDLLDDICRVVCEEAGYRMAWVGFAEQDRAKSVRPVAWAGVEDGYLAKARISWSEETDLGRGPAGVAIREGKSDCIQDFARDRQGAPWHENALERGYRAAIALPLKTDDGTTFGVFAIYSTEPDSFTPSEIHLLEELAANLAFGICVLRTRAEHRRAEEDLRISEGRFRQAQSVGHVGNWEYNLQTGKFWGSAEAKRIYGFDPEAPDFSTEEVESCIPARERVHQALVDLIERDAPYDLEFEIRPRGRGEGRFISSMAELKRDGDGKPLLVVGVMHDITEKKLAEEQIRQFNQELEARVAARTAQLRSVNQELEAFAYSISHDLRAPLRHINCFVGLLERRAGHALDDQSTRYMKTIAEAAARLGVLIDDLLTFSRMGRNEICASPTDLNAVLAEAMREAQSDMSGRTVVWNVTDLPVVNADTSMMRVVFDNLLANALKFTRTRARAEISVGQAPAPDGFVAVYVRDNGVGFDFRYVDKLFRVFQRLHRADEFEGTGIGLANVRRIVNRHGGTTWAEGAVGEGATFYFSLPAHVGSGQPAGAASSATSQPFLDGSR